MKDLSSTYFDPQLFVLGLKEANVPLTLPEVKDVAMALDQDENGHINPFDFLTMVDFCNGAFFTFVLMELYFRSLSFFCHR
jgi:hypothetical protein